MHGAIIRFIDVIYCKYQFLAVPVKIVLITLLCLCSYLEIC